MKTIFFIRHAQSEANAGFATIDDESIMLSPKGRQQAIELANNIHQKPDLIIYTKYPRTSETAAPLIEKFPHTTLNILPLHEFTYLPPAQFANTTVHQRQNWVFDYWEQADPHLILGPGAESFSQFIHRIEESLEVLTAIEHNNIIVFSHGHVLRAIWQILSGHHFSCFHEQMHHFHHHMGLLQVPNTCIFKANFNDNEWQIIDPQPPDFLFS